MRGRWLAVMVLACCTPRVDRPQVDLRPRSRSVTNDGRVLPIDVINDGGAGLVTLSTSLGVIEPQQVMLGPSAQATVSFTCRLADLPSCRGQAVVNADTVDEQGSHQFVSTTVQVTDPEPGFVAPADGGCDASHLLGATTECCWSPAISTTAPQCGWLGEPGNLGFDLSIDAADAGGLTLARFDFRVPEHWADPAECAAFHPGFGASVAGAKLKTTCVGYGVDFFTGAWSPLAFASCTVGDDFFAQLVCPRLGTFSAAAFALTLPGADGGLTVFTVMPR